MSGGPFRTTTPIAAACLAGLLLVTAGLLLESPWFLRFAAARVSDDGVLDSYTCDKVGEFAWKLATAGLLLPLIVLTAPVVLSRRPGPRAARLLAAAGLVAVMAGFLWLSAVTPYQASAPRTQPDEIQYTVPAASVAEGGRLAMTMNGREFPPYTPIGFQLLLIPFYRLCGTGLGNGILLVQAAALLSLAGVCLLGACTLGRKNGMLAVLLLAANPSFIFWTGRIMPTTVTLVLTLATLLLLLVFGRTESGRGRTLVAALLGAVSGAQVTVSYSTILIAFVVFILLLRASAERRGAGDARVCGAAFLLAACIAFLPQMAHQYRAYGSPFKIGYFVWFWGSPPPGTARDIPFTLARMRHDTLLLDLLSTCGFDARVRYPVALLLDLSGLGALYNLAVFTLFAVGIAALRRQRAPSTRVVAGFIALFGLFNCAAYAFYATPGTRYFLPVVPCVLVIAAEGFLVAFAAARNRAAACLCLLPCALLAFALSGAAGAARERVVGSPPAPCLYELATAYEEEAGEGTLVVSGVSGAYLCRFFRPGKGIVWLPVSRNVRLARQAGRPLFPVASEEPGLIRRHLSAGGVVLADEFYRTDFEEEYAALEKEFVFERVREVCGHGMYRLRAKATDDAPGAGQ